MGSESVTRSRNARKAIHQRRNPLWCTRERTHFELGTRWECICSHQRPAKAPREHNPRTPLLLVSLEWPAATGNWSLCQLCPALIYFHFGGPARRCAHRSAAGLASVQPPKHCSASANLSRLVAQSTRRQVQRDQPSRRAFTGICRRAVHTAIRTPRHTAPH